MFKSCLVHTASLARILLIAVGFFTFISCGPQKESSALEAVNALQSKPFDPEKWANFTGGSRVNAITRAGGKIWAATKGNLVQIDPASGKKVFYNEANSGLPDSWINEVAADSAGDLWLGFSNYYKIFRFRPAAPKQRQWTLFREEPRAAFAGNPVECIAPAGDGGLWIAHRSKFAYVSPGPERTIEVYDAYEGFQKKEQLKDVRGFDAMAVDAGGILWIAAASSHLVRFDHRQHLWEAIRIGGDQNGHFDVQDMAIGPQGHIWLAAEQGILRFRENQWSIYDRTNIDVPDFETRGRSETALDVHSIDAAENGSLYAASEHGLLVYKNEGWAYLFDFELTPDHEVTSLLAENDRLWVGNDAFGLIELATPARTQNHSSGIKKGPWTDGWTIKRHHCSPLHFQVDRVPHICAAPDGAVWIGNDFIRNFGALRFHPDSTKPLVYNKINAPLPDNKIADIAVAPDGTPWFVTTEGIMYPEKNGGWRTYHPENSGLPDNPTDLKIDGAGTVYAATNKGLAMFDGQRWSADVPGMDVKEIALGPDRSVWVLSERKAARYDGSEWTVYDPGDGGVRTGNGLESIYVDQNGDAWIGIDAVRTMGLARVSKNGDWQSFGEAPGSTVYGVVEDQNGNLWTGSWNGGLNRYRPQKSGRNAWQTFNPGNSPLPSENVIALEVDSNGNLWIGNREGGLTVYNPDGLAF